MDYERKDRLLWWGVALCLLACFQALGAEVVGLPTIQLTATNAVIRWTTDVATGTRAAITPAGPKVTVTAGKSPATHHAAEVADLRPGVAYAIRVGTGRVWLATNTFTFAGEAGSETASRTAGPGSPPPRDAADESAITSKTWGNPASLQDHFQRHGADFKARNADEYARMAGEFLRRARTEGLPAKIDDENVLRVFDPKTGAFGAYNQNGSTRTFFKARSRDYFDRQPGKPVNLKTRN